MGLDTELYMDSENEEEMNVDQMNGLNSKNVLGRVPCAELAWDYEYDKLELPRVWDPVGHTSS